MPCPFVDRARLESIGLDTDILRLERDQKSRSLIGDKSIDDQALLGSKDNLFLPHVQTVKSNVSGRMAEVRKYVS